METPVTTPAKHAARIAAPRRRVLSCGFGFLGPRGVLIGFCGLPKLAILLNSPAHCRRLWLRLEARDSVAPWMTPSWTSERKLAQGAWGR